jgi:hypothetical protein
LISDSTFDKNYEMRKRLFIFCLPLLTLAACGGETNVAEETTSTETETKSAPVPAADTPEIETKKMAPANEETIVSESEVINKKAESAGNVADSILNSL